MTRTSLRASRYRQSLGAAGEFEARRPGRRGKTWTSADILRDHLALRQRFGGARLVWSGHWTTFSGPDFWVTVVGPAQPTAAEANRWCDSNGFGADDCFAKFISTLVGAKGTTVYRK